MMYFEKFAAGSVMSQVVIAVCKQNIASCMNAEEGRKYENFTNWTSNDIVVLMF